MFRRSVPKLRSNAPAPGSVGCLDRETRIAPPISPRTPAGAALRRYTPAIVPGRRPTESKMPDPEGDTVRTTNSPRHPAAPLAFACVLLAALAAAGPADAQELYTYTLSAFGGLGGSLDADPGDGLSNSAFQLGASFVTEPHTRVALRAGRLGLGDGNRFGNRLTDAELDYVTLAGEYRFKERYYDSWTYIGLGGYRVEGDRLAGGGRSDETSIGLALGLVGEFTVSRAFDVVVEISGHYADLDEAQTFAMGHAGLSFHF